MKKHILLSLIVLMGMTTLNANPIDVTRAKAIGQKFAQANFKNISRSNELQLVYTGSSTRGDACFYAFNAGDNAFVIVSADDRFRPIVGYSDEGPFDTENPSPELMFYLDKIIEARTSGNAVIFDDTDQEWQSVASTGRMLSRNGGRGVDYICTTKWNQDSPYNLYAPQAGSGPGGRCYAGCVATAMSQVMKRWDFPAKGTGNHSYYCYGYGQQSANFGATTYDWEHMPDRLATASQQEIEAVALLMYHCAVAVDMDFSPNGSGASSWSVPDAIEQYFSYSSHADIKMRDHYSLNSWQNMLKEQFDIGWPVYYSGYSNDGGHAFVCDGYDDNNLFHFNWGWGGSSDGWFVIDEIDYAGWAQVVFNFVPSDVYTYMPFEPENFSVTTSGDFDYAATLTWTNPTQNIHLQNLTNIDQIVVTRNGKIIHTEDNVTPGAQMSYTDHYMPRMVNYSVYAVVHSAKGLAATEKNVVLGPTCTWTVEMNSSSPQGWKGGTLSFINGAGDEVARLSLTSTQATRTITLPFGHIEIHWESPEQTLDDFRFKIRNADGTPKAYFRGSSSEIQNGLFYIANNTCDDMENEIDGTFLTATIDDGQVTLSWDPIDNSIFYQVHRDGLLYDVTTETTYIDNNTRETFHTYHVTAFTNDGETLPSNRCSYQPESNCLTPINFKVEYSDPGKAKLSWEVPAEHPSGYMIYRRVKGEEFRRIKLLTGTSFTDNLNTQPDGHYEYAVTAYFRDTQCESGYASAESNPELNYVEFNKTIIPTHLDFYIYNNHVVLQWEEASMAENYNIYRNGELIAHAIPGNSYYDYHATPLQSYTYTITGRTGHMESNRSNTVYVDWTTGVNDNTENQEISIYPNPTENIVNIKANGLQQVKVINVTGQEVKCLTTLEDNVIIDLSAQPKGCYFIETLTEQGSTTTKIMKY